MWYFSYFFRVLQDNFLLVRGELKVPVDFVRCKVAYKYVLFQKARGSKEEDLFFHEHLIKWSHLTNRCLDIPETKRKAGSESNT